MRGTRVPTASKDFLRVRQSEFLVVAAVQFAGPGIEQLNDLCAGFDLKQQIRADGGCKLVQQRVQHSRLAIGEAFDLGKALGAAAFDHVRRERPRGACEANQRHLILKFLAELLDDRSDERNLRGRIRNARARRRRC